MHEGDTVTSDVIDLDSLIKNLGYRICRENVTTKMTWDTIVCIGLVTDTSDDKAATLSDAQCIIMFHIHKLWRSAIK